MPDGLGLSVRENNNLTCRGFQILDRPLRKKSIDPHNQTNTTAPKDINYHKPKQMEFKFPNIAVYCCLLHRIWIYLRHNIQTEENINNIYE